MRGHRLTSLLTCALFLGCANSDFTGTSKEAAKPRAKDAPDAGDGGEDAESRGDTDRGGRRGRGGADGDGQDGGGGGGLDGEGDALGGSADTDGGQGGGGSDVVSDTDAIADESGLMIEEDGQSCLMRPLPVRIVFAIDSTGSMEDSIAAVVQNVQAFAARVKEIVPKGGTKPLADVQVGVVSYVDSPSQNQVYALTDPATLAGQIAGLDSRGGPHDHIEGGLQAALAAFDLLSAADQQSSHGVVPVLVVISDNVSHDGTGSHCKRNMDPAAVAARAGTKALRNLLLFDAVPAQYRTVSVPFYSDACTPATTVQPPSQWRAVREGWLAKHPKVKAEPGANLGWPFTATTLVDRIPAEIAKRVRLCN